jgi:hypothetical protein
MPAGSSRIGLLPELRNERSRAVRAQSRNGTLCASLGDVAWVAMPVVHVHHNGVSIPPCRSGQDWNRAKSVAAGASGITTGYRVCSLTTAVPVVARGARCRTW